MKVPPLSGAKLVELSLTIRCKLRRFVTKGASRRVSRSEKRTAVAERTRQGDLLMQTGVSAGIRECPHELEDAPPSRPPTVRLTGPPL